MGMERGNRGILFCRFCLCSGLVVQICFSPSCGDMAVDIGVRLVSGWCPLFVVLLVQLCHFNVLCFFKKSVQS
jgi:hypothetical protein